MTRKSRARRACAMCKPHKRWGNRVEKDKPSVRRRKEAARAQVADAKGEEK